MISGTAERLIRRSGAGRATGSWSRGRSGAAAAGLLLLAQGVRLDEDGGSSPPGLDRVLARALSPVRAGATRSRPPIALGRGLGESDIAHAAIDLSDGLSGDLLAGVRGQRSSRLDRRHGLARRPGCRVVAAPRGGTQPTWPSTGAKAINCCWPFPGSCRRRGGSGTHLERRPHTRSASSKTGEPTVSLRRPRPTAARDRRSRPLSRREPGAPGRRAT